MANTDLLLTVSALEGLPEDGNRYEVIKGELHLAGAPFFTHQNTVGNLLSAMMRYLKDHPIGRAVWGLRVVFDQFNAVVPDLIFISHDRLKRTLAAGQLTGAPEIVVEILSPGSANENRDRSVKRNLYSTHGVSGYWIVDPEARTVSVSRKRKEGGLKPAVVLQVDDDLTSPLLPEFRVPVAQLFE